VLYINALRSYHILSSNFTRLSGTQILCKYGCVCR